MRNYRQGISNQGSRGPDDTEWVGAASKVQVLRLNPKP